MDAIVRELIYKDTEPELLYSIKVSRNIRGLKTERFEIAFPLDTNIKRIPVVGEMVKLLTGTSPSSSPDKSKRASPDRGFQRPVRISLSSDWHNPKLHPYRGSSRDPPPSIDDPDGQ